MNSAFRKAVFIGTMLMVAANGQVDLCDLPSQVRQDQYSGLGNRQALGVRGEIHAPQVVRDLEEYAGLAPDTYNLFPTRDPRVVSNAIAQKCGNERYIFYDDRYFSSIPGSGGRRNWTAYFIFAHETGHHQLEHFGTRRSARLRMELEADEYAGFALGRMRVPMESLMAAIDFVQPTSQGSTEYPGRCERRRAALEGFNRAAKQMEFATWQFQGCAPVPSPMLDSSGNGGSNSGINEFKWKFLSAMNAWASTGDITALLNLSVEKYNAMSDAQRQQMQQMAEVWPRMLAERRASIHVTIDEWEVIAVNGDEASVRHVLTFGGQENGVQREEKQRGILKLAKIRGEWLLAAGGRPF